MHRVTHYKLAISRSKILSYKEQTIRDSTDQTRFGAKSDHSMSRLCYGLRRYIFGVAPRRYDVSRCVPISHGSAPGIGDRAPLFAGVSTASHGSRTAEPRCYTVACKIP